MARIVENFVGGHWRRPGGQGREIADPVTGEIVSVVAVGGAPADEILEYARTVGGPTLAALTFHERADLLDAACGALTGAREELYALSTLTGATARDAALDVDGGIGTLKAYARMARRELPDTRVIVEGEVERLSKSGSFVGQHVLTTRRGVVLQINAYNFPVWGVCEKLAASLLAGLPSIVKPATQTAFVAEAAVRALVACDALAIGAIQFVTGAVDDVLDRLDGQDAAQFTGSAATASILRSHPAFSTRSARINVEADSLNAAILGPDAAPGSPTFGLYISALVDEMTIKSGQKCTAIRRAFVPRDWADAVIDAASQGLAQVKVGDPRDSAVTMGPLVSVGQRSDVAAAAAKIAAAGEIAVGHADLLDGAGDSGAFLPPMLLYVDDSASDVPHRVEAFGPVSTVLPYDGADDLIAAVARGDGSLVTSIVSSAPAFVDEIVTGIAPHNGRLLVLDPDCAAGSTGHGTPMPGLLHGGPGRAGGGEEEGGLRAVALQMQRVALQGSPEVVGRLANRETESAPSFPK